MSATGFTELVGCTAPIQQAPMGGGVAGPRLAAAVSAAGGLGMLSATYPRLSLPDQFAEVRRMTTAPVGVAFFGFDFPHRTADLELAASQARLIDFFWGHPDPTLVERAHAGGALACWQAGSRDEALAARDAGCDIVVAQGVEAGGHVRGTTPLRTLLDEVVSAVDIPVLAAGGITTAGQLRDVLDAGASGARIGTRFLVSEEAECHPDYLVALLAATGEDTELTTAFGLDWPDAPHRVLRRAIDAARQLPTDAIGTTEFEGQPFPLQRWSAIPPFAACRGHVEAMAMYAGCGVGDIAEILSAADIVDRLVTTGR